MGIRRFFRKINENRAFFQPLPPPLAQRKRLKWLRLYVFYGNHGSLFKNLSLFTRYWSFSQKS